MERRLFVDPAEFDLVRIVCKKTDCRGAIEVPVAQLNRVPAYETNCPACGDTLARMRDSHSHVLSRLQQVLVDLKSDPGFAVEFVLPAPADSSAR